ncbi:MAG TPA: secretin N-terminal domain-containing protein [Gemmatimonadaceae bacterium]|nr:secretin N-terminal domain-containing protein [Gemmatimonadaceae bacterium]
MSGVHRAALLLLALLPAARAGAQSPPAAPPRRVPPPVERAAERAVERPSDSVTIRVVNTELRAAVQILQQYLDRPVLFSGPGGAQVSLETPRPVPRADVVRLVRGLLDSQNYELVDDSASGMYRARPKAAPAPAGPASASSSASLQRPSGTPEIFVVPLRHVRAADVATTINTLFGRGAVAEGARAARPATLTEELRANQVPPVGTAPSPLTGVGARPATLTGELTIVADEKANSLIVRANRADYELLRAVVTQLDVRPMQVLIEMLIVEARRDRSLTFGIDAKLPTTGLRGGGNTTMGGELTAGTAGLGEFTLKVMGLGGVDVEATIRAAAGRGDVKIVSRPVVITTNNEEAEVVVGSQRPFVQVSRALPTDAAVRDQIVQYKDVGTKLTVRPTISTDGTVQLEVVQEVSSATTETAFNAPVISTRSIRTELLARDGQTIALGGLTDKQRDIEQRGVPILSGIPVLGALFGRAARRSTETELFIFLTPRIIRTDADAERITTPLRKRADEVTP